jgi:hypothetical protein
MNTWLPAVVVPLAFVLSCLYIAWRMRDRILGLGFRLAFKFAGGLGAWYWFTQLLAPDDKKLPIPSNYRSFEEITQDLKGLPYEYDPDIVKGLNFDSIHHPRHSYWLAMAGLGTNDGKPDFFEPRRGGDCDDSASAWCACVWKNRKRLGIKDVYFGVIAYFKTDDKGAAHAVCVLEHEDGRCAHVGNWYGNVPQYTPDNTPERALRHFVEQNDYRERGGALLKIKGMTGDDRLVFGRAQVLG